MRPAKRHFLRHRQSHNPPNATSTIPNVGMAESSMVAPGQAETVRATAITASIPHPMGANARLSNPNGISRKATIAQGMIQNPVRGMANKFAATPYSATRSK